LNKNIFETGMTAVEVVAGIIKQNPRIKALSFYICTPKKNVSETPGYHSFGRLLSHNSPNGKEIWLKREEITADKLYGMIGGLGREHVLAVLSKVVFKHNETFHLPLMDFSERSAGLENNLTMILCFLEQAGYGNGVVLSSGRSFHYYGNCLMNERVWRIFLGDCLLSGLADPRYVGHNIKDGCATLRLSACSLRPHIPEVVSVLN